MRHIRVGHLILAFAQIERIEALTGMKLEPVPGSVDDEVAPSLRKHVIVHYREIETAAEAADAPLTKISATRAIARLKARGKPLTYRGLAEINKDVGQRLEDEIFAPKFYCLSKGAAAYYSPPSPLFGAEVEARIPRANDDISEAGKCFAVGRYTACAFHLMRAMESAVQSLSTALKIVNVEREWGKLLSDIDEKIKDMPKGAGKDEWSQVRASLYHVKQTWRNSTMHPKRTYTEEEAREVFDAMKAFMRHLATLLPPSAEE